jgi:hypothetical protein
MRTTEHKLYLVIAPPPKWHWWKKSVIVKTTRKKPKLREGQVGALLEISIPDNLLEPFPSIAIKLSPENLIRPEVKVSQG